MVPPLGKRPPKGSAGAGISVSAQSSSISQLVEQIIDTTGIDPCREPDGLDLSLNITELPGGEDITVTWLPTAPNTGGSSSRPSLTR